MQKLDKSQIGMAGEMRVVSELLKRGHNASITFGNAKATDIVILGEQSRFLRVEVKTSKNGFNFVTGFYPKYSNPDRTHPDVWVLFLPNKDANSDGDIFYILTHAEVEGLQLQVNRGVKTEPGKGCDNIPLKHLQLQAPQSQGRWDLFAVALENIK